MMPSLITRLCNIGMKPGISAATQLITTRRICRAIADQLDVIRSERRALRRQAGKLKAFLPFTRQTIAELEEQANEHQEASRSGAWSALAGFGQSLMFDREGLARALGFDQMCDLLGVNPVHRQQAGADSGTSLRGVAYISRLEDSADRKNDEWGAGGPLYQACHAAMIRLIRECPEDQLPDPFATGTRSAQSCRQPDHRRQLTIFRATFCESRKRGATPSNTTGHQPMTSASGAQRKHD